MNKPTEALFEQIFKTTKWKEFENGKLFNEKLPLYTFVRILTEIRIEVTGKRTYHSEFLRFDQYVSDLMRIMSRKNNAETIDDLVWLKHPGNYIRKYKGMKKDHQTLLAILEQVFKSRDFPIFKWEPNKKPAKVKN